MKILIDARLYGPENTGNGRYTMNLTESLARLDSRNRYIILLRKKYYKSLELPSNWRKVMADFRHYSFTEQFKLPYIIWKFKPDIVHFPHFNVPLFFFGKYVVTIHDMIMHKFRGGTATSRPFLVNIMFRLAYYVVFSKAVTQSEKIIVPTKAVKDEIMRYYKISKNKICVVHEGFDVRIGVSRKRFSRSRYFLYVGNAYPHKNLENLINAMVLLNDEKENKVKLLIASPRSVFTQRLEKLIDKHNARKSVKLLGFVADKDLGALYKNSIAFVSPSMAEGFGLPGLEAMSSGTIFLASNIPVYKEVFENNAIYFDPKNPVNIKNAMQKASTLSVTRRRAFIAKGRRFVKKYSWLKMAKETLEQYQA